MMRHATVMLGLVAGCGCSTHTAAPTTTTTTTTTTTPAVGSEPVATASPCDELVAALEASVSGYPGYAIADQPATSGADVAGFVSSRTIPGATSCIVQGDPDPALWCSLGAPALPTESGAILTAWESKLEACPGLGSLGFKKYALGEYGHSWSDNQATGERTISLAFSGADDRPTPVLVIRRFK